LHDSSIDNNHILIFDTGSTKMKFKVSNKSILDATKCRGSFSCLNGMRDCLCDIDDCSDGKIHFVKPMNFNANCEYRIPFGHSQTCNCPVRKEIYNEYRV